MALDPAFRPLLELPGMQLAARQGRDHRRQALSALADFPAEHSA